jgi:hypothetical protein
MAALANDEGEPPSLLRSKSCLSNVCHGDRRHDTDEGQVAVSLTRGSSRATAAEASIALERGDIFFAVSSTTLAPRMFPCQRVSFP